ncbi:hypothetical protein MATL_G00053540 [Megalops atlanticus]|uniref:WD repeat domain 74 n=1 Tax=Megalops atlanticus TaxID=7932 RepID=A0A9D3QF78_MEGAT|nr:hypothetical protein MATL_G00053540 [Megalops atlanticus]
MGRFRNWNIKRSEPCQETGFQLLVRGVGGLCEWDSEDFQHREGDLHREQAVWRQHPGRFTGLAVTDSALVTCVESGLVKVWKEGSSDTVEINAGSSVCRMRQNSVKRHHVATGGKENPLKVWDLERPDTPVFTAKNVRNDWLDLRVPEWVRDMAFIPDSDKIVTCTGHHQVRVYDPASPQRRPVLEAQFGEYPLTALSLPASPGSVVVGNTQGQIAILDLRKGLVRGCLKGLAGGVRGLQCHPSLPLVASCGLDRFLRVHSLEDRRLQHKVYLKSRLNCVLLSSRDLEACPAGTENEEEVKEEEQCGDEVWETMETVTEGRRKRRAEQTGDKGGKKTSVKKKKTVKK